MSEDASLCASCKRYIPEFNRNGVYRCTTFPLGIPHDIFFGKILHTKPYKSNDEQVFDPIDSDAQEYADFLQSWHNEWEKLSPEEKAAAEEFQKLVI